MEAWQEALGAFGLGDLTRELFMENVSQRSDSEVMMATCPYTTRLEWPSVLNKKRVRITREVSEWCFANAVPVPGLVDFLERCDKQFASASAASAADASSCGPGMLALWMTPWTAEQGQRALAAAGLKAVVVPTQVQHSQFAFFDTLEAFGLRPPLETPDALRALMQYRTTAGAGVTAQAGSAGDVVDPSPGAAGIGAGAHMAPTPQAIHDWTERHKRLRAVRAGTADERRNADDTQHQLQQLPTQTRVVYFTGSARNARIATSNGLAVVGVSYNNFDQESDASSALVPGCNTDQELLAAGARVVIRDFTKMLPEYLLMI